MANATDIGRANLTADTAPLTLHQLTGEQKELLKGIWDLLQSMASDRTPVPSNEPASPWALAPTLHRSYRTILIDGIRGSGKTALMLTLLAVSRARSPDGRDDPGEFNSAAVREFFTGDANWRFAPPIDFDPLPDHIHAFAWLVYALHGLAEFATGDGPTQSKSGRRTPTLIQEWRDLYRQALLGWNASWDQQKMNQDIDLFVELQRERARDWSGLVAAWRRFVDNLLGALEQAGPSGLSHGGLLVLPIDDLDLHPERAFELLQALRMCWHPRVVFLVTGRRSHMQRIMADQLVGQARGLAKVFWQDGREAQRLEETDQLARDIFVKTIPPKQTFQTELVGLLQFLEGQFPGKPAGWGSRDQFLASWPAELWPDQRRLVELLFEGSPKGSRLGFAMRDLIGYAGSTAGDTARQLVALLSLVQSDLFDDVLHRESEADIKLFAVPALEYLFGEARWRVVTQVRFFRADATRAVEAEPEAVLLAEFAGLGDLPKGRIAWDSTMPVPTVAAVTILLTGERFMLTWPERLASRPSEVAAWITLARTPPKEPNQLVHGRSNMPLALQIFERAAAWRSSGREATGLGLGVPAWAWQIDPRIERADLELSLWLAVPESGISPDDRHALLVGAGLRLGGSDELSAAETIVGKARFERLEAAQRVGRLLPESRGYSWPRMTAEGLARLIDQGVGEDDPWNVRGFLLRPNWTDWDLSVPSLESPAGVLTRRIASLFHVRYQRPTGAGSRRLLDLFTEQVGQRELVLPAAQLFGTYLVSPDPGRRQALWQWLTAVLGIFPPNTDSMAGASKLVALWKAAAAACGKVPIDMRLTEGGSAIAITASDAATNNVQLTVSIHQPTSIAGLEVHNPGDWGVAVNGTQYGAQPWGIFLFAGCSLNHDMAQEDPDVTYGDFSLLSGKEGASITVPVAKMGWRSAEQVRLRWNRFVARIPADESRPELAVRRWLLANALQAVAGNWFNGDPGNAYGEVSFPVDPSWFHHFASLHIEQKVHRGLAGEPVAEWAAGIDSRIFPDTDCRTEWRAGQPSTASTLTP